MTFFRIERLVVAFGGLVALNDVSLTVEEGEIRGLIGPNGAGKSSLLNVVSGFVRPRSGRVVLRDQELQRLPPHEIAARGVGRTFQHLEIFPDQTVLSNVLIGRHLHVRSGFLGSALWLPSAREAEREARERAEELLVTFRLAAVRDAVAGDLPFGMLKRVALARALAAGPSLLLVDEPTSGMSELDAEDMIRTLRDAARAKGLTLLVVEHNMHVIMSLADRISVLNYGELIAEGTPDEVQRDPAVIAAYLEGHR